MASGSFNLSRTGSTSSYITFKCNWSSTPNQSANTSTVTVTVTASKSSSSTADTYGNQTTDVTVGSSSQSNSGSFRLSPSKTVTLFSKTFTVAHNSDGTKSVKISVSVGGNVIYANGSQTVTLDKIPRYATVNQSLTAKTETTATISWTSDAIVDYIWYSTNNGSSWSGINVADGTSGSYTISGLFANTTYQIKTRVRRKDSQLTTDSSALSVTTYAYPYANSMPNFTIGSKLTIGIYNPLGRQVTVNILGADNSQISNDTTYGTSISGYNGTGVVNALYNSIPNAQSGTYKVKVTYGSSIVTKTGGTYSINANICTPSIGSVSYQDRNQTTIALTGNNQDIVRNHSTLSYSASGLTAKNGASVRSCSVTVNGATIPLTVSGSSASGTGGVIDSGMSLDAVFTVTDSRGLTGTKKITVNMLDWSVPSAIITLQRQDNFYTATDLTVDAQIAYINGNNRVTITYQATKEGDSSPSVSGSLQDNVTSVIQLDNNYAWTVVVTLVDSLGGTTSYSVYISRGMPIIYFDRLKSSVGINCFPQDEQSLEVDGVNILDALENIENALVRNVMTAYLNANVTNLAVSTYTIVPLNGSNGVGSKLTLQSDGGIKIGAGVSKILVSARASIQGSATTGRRHLRVMKNSYTNNNTIAWSQDDFGASVTEDIVITPTVGDVQEGDVVYLWYYVPNSADTIGGNAYGCRTSMTIEVIG